MGYSEMTGNYYSDDFENQHEPVDEIQVRILLPGSNCGPVIGKGGTNLAKFRSENNVDINLVGDRNTDRVLNIIGHQENCLNVVNEIVQLCPVAPYTVAQNCAVETNFLILSDLIGHLVGKGGSKLKEIREQSNSKIKIYPECMPGSNERVVAVGGEDQEVIINALRIILNTVEDKLQTQQQIFYDPIQNNQSDANAYQSQQDFGYSAPESISSEFLLVETETNVKVSNQMCGAIIGKQGMRIREIRNVSGAKITFANNDEGRIINITGSQQQVQAAEHLMTQAVRSSVINTR